MKARTLGIDVGTSGLKAMIVESVDGHVTRALSQDVRYQTDGQPTRDADRWVLAAREAIEALQLTEPLTAVSFTGQMHALVAVDANHRPVAPARLWLDYEGEQALKRFVARNPDLDLLERTGNIPLSDFTLAKWLGSLEEQRFDADDILGIVGAKDYVRLELTGATQLTTDVNDAAGTQLYDPYRHEWDEDIRAAANLARSALPTVGDPTDPAGEMLGAPVAIGTGDQAAAARAVGAWNPHIASLSLGTSGVLAAAVELASLPTPWDGRFHLLPLRRNGPFQMIGTVPSLGPTLRWAQTLLGATAWDFDAMARSAIGRPNPVRFFPWLGGRGAPDAAASLRGALLGIAESTGPADIASAVYLGIAAELAYILEQMRSYGAVIEEVVCSGGGTQSPFLIDVISACLTARVSLASSPGASAAGASLLALEHATGFTDATVPRRLQRPAPNVSVPSSWAEERLSLVARGSSVFVKRRVGGT
jgi:xylulokinase